MFHTKLMAAFKHLMVTSLVVACAAYLVFFVWYPGFYSAIMPAAQLFTIVACVELVLGPCMSLVIYNPGKTKKSLIRDYAVIVAIQLSALMYGLMSVTSVRPVVAFVGDNAIQLIEASQLNETAGGEFKASLFSGPQLRCSLALNAMQAPETYTETETEGVNTKNFMPCDKVRLTMIARKVADLRSVAEKNKDQAILDELAKIENVDSKYLWLPIKSRFSSGLAFINIESLTLEFIIDSQKKVRI